MSKQNNASLADFLDFMSRKGLNTTSQRRVIAEAFFELPGHHSLEEFYQYILGRDPGIGQTTVYRTLKLLCDAGLATEIHFSDGITRYEVARPDSHHDQLAEKHGFSLNGHVHNLYGLCADCRAAESKD